MNYTEQCSRGKVAADKAIAEMRTSGNPLLLKGALDGLQNEGERVGFLQRVAETLIIQ